MSYLAKRVESMKESVTLSLNGKVAELKSQGKKIYNLTAGQLPMLPPSEFRQQICKSSELNESFLYAPVSGTKSLKEKVLKEFVDSRKISDDTIKDMAIVSCNGAKQGIFNTLAAILDEGDEIILLAPYWGSYREMIKFLGGVPVEVSTSLKEGFIPSIKLIEEAITDKTKAILLNTPNNPSGVTYPQSWMEEYADLQDRKVNFLTISDEIYFDLQYGNESGFVDYYYTKRPELLKRTVVCDSISKSLASPGLRLGWIIAPKEIAKAVNTIQGQTTSGANSLIQSTLSGFSVETKHEFVKGVNAMLFENRETIKRTLMDNDLENYYYQIDGAFYFLLDLRFSSRYLDISKGGQIDATFEMATWLLDNHEIAVVPGSDFGSDHTVRLSLGNDGEIFSQAFMKLIAALS